jgi:hypothetical protein
LPLIALVRLRSWRLDALDVAVLAKGDPGRYAVPLTRSPGDDSLPVLVCPDFDTPEVVAAAGVDIAPNFRYS